MTPGRESLDEARVANRHVKLRPRAKKTQCHKRRLTYDEKVDATLAKWEVIIERAAGHSGLADRLSKIDNPEGVKPLLLEAFYSGSVDGTCPKRPH